MLQGESFTIDLIDYRLGFKYIESRASLFYINDENFLIEFDRWQLIELQNILFQLIDISELEDGRVTFKSYPDNNIYYEFIKDIALTINKPFKIKFYYELPDNIFECPIELILSKEQLKYLRSELIKLIECMDYLKWGLC